MIKAFSFENDVKEFAANIYVVGKKGSKCIVVDMGTTSPEVIDFIKKNFTGVEAILLTHAHYDHIRGVSKFLKNFSKDIPIYLHEDDFEMLVNDELNRSVFHDEKITIDYEPILIKDGQILKFETMNIEVIHTPFHTKGSVCYLSKEDNAIFTGDTLFKGAIGRSDFINSEPDKISSSLMKLTKLNELLVCYPGHGDITSLKTEKATNPYFRG